jgi:hypothetical protein
MIAGSRKVSFVAPPPALAAPGYIRVSYPKQIEGVSLDQQKGAIRTLRVPARPRSGTPPLL